MDRLTTNRAVLAVRVRWAEPRLLLPACTCCLCCRGACCLTEKKQSQKEEEEEEERRCPLCPTLVAAGNRQEDDA